MQDNWHILKLASQFIKYAHINLITDIFILVISETIFQVRAFKFGSLGALKTLINMNPGFVIIAKF